MNVTIENHRWIQDPRQTKSALCFDLADLPTDWSPLLEFVSFQADATDETKARWKVKVKVGKEEHELIFPVHIQLLLGQAKLYQHITVVGLDADDHWSIAQLLAAPVPAQIASQTT